MRSLVASALVLCLASCESAESPSFMVRPTLDEPAAVEAVLGPAGGILEATAADGTAARLEIPEGALLAETTITMTPLVSVAGLPDGATFVAGVDFAPDGLDLWRAATLTLRVPDGAATTDPDAFVAFGYEGDGERFGVDVAGADPADSRSIRLAVRHFSGGGLLLAPQSAADLPPLGDEVPYRLAIVDAHNAGADPESIAAIFDAWFDELVRPRLEVAEDSEEQLLLAMRSYRNWRDDAFGSFEGDIGNLPLALGWAPSFTEAVLAAGVTERDVAGRPLVAAGLRAGVDRNQALCEADHDLAGTEGALRWQAIAEAFGVDTVGYSLDLEGVLAALCGQVLLEEISFDQAPTVGVPGLLQLAGGLTFDGETVAAPTDPASYDLFLDAETSGAAEGDVFEAGVGGAITASFTPTGGTELVIRARVCPGALAPADFPVLTTRRDSVGATCQDVVIVRGLGLTPQTAVVASGDTVDFDATLFGEPHPDVTYEATGGTVDADGVYTAGSVGGSYAVTAVSQTTPGLTQSATVTVDGDVPQGCEVPVVMPPCSNDGKDPRCPPNLFARGVPDSLGEDLVAATGPLDATWNRSNTGGTFTGAGEIDWGEISVACQATGSGGNIAGGQSRFDLADTIEVRPMDASLVGRVAWVSFRFRETYDLVWNMDDSGTSESSVSFGLETSSEELAGGGVSSFGQRWVGPDPVTHTLEHARRVSVVLGEPFTLTFWGGVYCASDGVVDVSLDVEVLGAEVVDVRATSGTIEGPIEAVICSASGTDWNDLEASP